MWEQKQFITVVQTRNLENKICEDSEGETNSRNAYETKVASCAVAVQSLPRAREALGSITSTAKDEAQ